MGGCVVLVLVDSESTGPPLVYHLSLLIVLVTLENLALLAVAVDVRVVAEAEVGKLYHRKSTHSSSTYRLIRQRDRKHLDPALSYNDGGEPPKFGKNNRSKQVQVQMTKTSVPSRPAPTPHSAWANVKLVENPTFSPRLATITSQPGQPTPNSQPPAEAQVSESEYKATRLPANPTSALKSTSVVGQSEQLLESSHQISKAQVLESVWKVAKLLEKSINVQKAASIASQSEQLTEKIHRSPKAQVLEHGWKTTQLLENPICVPVNATTDVERDIEKSGPLKLGLSGNKERQDDSNVQARSPTKPAQASALPKSVDILPSLPVAPEVQHRGNLKKPDTIDPQPRSKSSMKVRSPPINAAVEAPNPSILDVATPHIPIEAINPGARPAVSKSLSSLASRSEYRSVPHVLGYGTSSEEDTDDDDLPLHNVGKDASTDSGARSDLEDPYSRLSLRPSHAVAGKTQTSPTAQSSQCTTPETSPEHVSVTYSNTKSASFCTATENIETSVATEAVAPNPTNPTPMADTVFSEETHAQAYLTPVDQQSESYTEAMSSEAGFWSYITRRNGPANPDSQPEPRARHRPATNREQWSSLGSSKWKPTEGN